MRLIDRNLKKTTPVILVVTLICIAFVLVSCGEKTEDKIIGSWYDDDMSELFFSEDGSFTLNDYGGTYSVDGERITLIDAWGEADTFALYDDGSEIYIYDTNRSREFYPYDVAWEKYDMKQAEAESERNSTVNEIKDYLIGTWENVDDFPDFIVTIKENNTLEIQSEYYGDATGTWEFESDGDDRRYFFIETHEHYGSGYGSGKEHSQDTFFYIPDWQYRDIDSMKITIDKMSLKKQ